MTTTHELILHIGHYKTGTTALQVFLERNRSLLAEQGLVYADAPVKFSKHSALAFSLLRDAGVTHLMHDFRNKHSAQVLWQDLFTATRALPAGASMLVSSEEFIRLGAHPAAAALLRDQIETARDLRFRVIAYLRPPQDHLKSWYNQLVKMGVDVGSFDAAVRAQMEQIHWDYALAIKPWLEIFGPEAIVLRGFEPALREGDALFEDFLSGLGFGLPIAATTTEGDPNPRMDDRVLGIRRALNRAGLPAEMSKQVMNRAKASFDAETASSLLPGAPGFETIRQRADLGIQALAALPGAQELDTAALRAALPAPQEATERQLEQAVVALSFELAQMRNAQMRQAMRINALEKRLNSADGPVAPTAASKK